MDKRIGRLEQQTVVFGIFVVNLKYFVCVVFWLFSIVFALFFSHTECSRNWNECGWFVNTVSK